MCETVQSTDNYQTPDRCTLAAGQSGQFAFSLHSRALHSDKQTVVIFSTHSQLKLYIIINTKLGM